LCPDGYCKEQCEITAGADECDFGCFYQDKCFPYGMRVSDLYCDSSNGMKTQLKSKGVCENNFECKSNICVDGECVSAGLMRKFLNWFRKLF